MVLVMHVPVQGPLELPRERFIVGVYINDIWASTPCGPFFLGARQINQQPPCAPYCSFTPALVVILLLLDSLDCLLWLCQRIRLARCSAA